MKINRKQKLKNEREEECVRATRDVKSSLQIQDQLSHEIGTGY